MIADVEDAENHLIFIHLLQNLKSLIFNLKSKFSITASELKFRKELSQKAKGCRSNLLTNNKKIKKNALLF